MKEITDYLGNNWKYDCMSCSIANGNLKLPGGLVFENNYLTIGADPEIPLNGFMVIATKRHINSISETTSQERYELIDYISRTIKALKDLEIVKEVLIVQEERSKHLHFWIFPCYEKYTSLFGRGIVGVNAIIKYVKENVNKEEIQECLKTVEKLKEYFGGRKWKE